MAAPAVGGTIHSTRRRSRSSTAEEKLVELDEELLEATSLSEPSWYVGVRTGSAFGSAAEGEEKGSPREGGEKEEAAPVGVLSFAA